LSKVQLAYLPHSHAMMQDFVTLGNMIEEFSEPRNKTN